MFFLRDCIQSAQFDIESPQTVLKRFATTWKRSALAALTLVLSVPGVGFDCSAASTAGKADVESIAAFPASLTLRAHRGGHRIAVTGRAGDGFEIHLTDAKLASDKADVAALNSHGEIVGLKPGQATVTATASGRSVTIPVTVEPEPAGGVSFKQDILPVLSKSGCNNGGCHAKPDGQNGFKLSVFAYDPQGDYYNIVKDGRGRRVFPAFPDESLLLKKPSLQVDHEGGQRFEKDSDSYRTVLRWISEGMIYEQAKEPELQTISVFPAERRYRKNAKQPLLVQAHYSDGEIRDVTRLAEYDSNEKDLATVDEHGVISVGSLSGEGVIVARFMGLVEISRVTVPSDRALPDSLYAKLPVHNFIDERVYERLQKLAIEPSEDCTDAEFLRRASLDLIGVAPTAEQTRDFLRDANPDKRVKLVDRLLEHPAYADHWATKWADLLRPNPSRVGVKSIYLLDQWLRDSFRENKSYDRMVREIVTAQGNTHRYGPAVVFRDRRNPEDVGEWFSQVFLGVRMECAKCHHHPNEKWSQADFYQFAAFFKDIGRKGTGISTPISGDNETVYFRRGSDVKHPVTGEAMPPKPLAGEEEAIPGETDPREALADWMTDPKNPYFARAAVNRVWAEFFGRGIVDPVDDFRASNPPINEPLLDALAEEFVVGGFDLKKLMRTIVSSRVYQLSSKPNETNVADTENFSRAYRRRLPAEVMLDAVADFTGSTESFQGTPTDTRAIATWNYKLDSEFLDAFGRPNSSAQCPCERDLRPSVVQALHLMHSKNLQAKLADKNGRAAKLASSDLPPEKIIQELYLAAFNREPQIDEIKIAMSAFYQPETTRQIAIEDVMWALINSAEFVFNH